MIYYTEFRVRSQQYNEDKINNVMIYLYLKTHNVTGLKYLGKTKKDPLIYKGSGRYWTKHIKKHGNDVTTEILKECQTNDEVKFWGLHYSNLWNIIESEHFANFMLEQGDGGDTSNSEDYKEAMKVRDVSGERNGMFGRSAVTESNLKWYTDGVQTIYVTEGTQPDGFTRGRKLGKRKPHSEKTKRLIGKGNTGRQSKSAISVISPDGEVFRSIQLAANSLGITMSAFRHRYENKQGWKFIVPE
jgi:hypothetical protein